MKNQITTIAALPNGAGQAAHLPAEVGREPKPDFHLLEVPNNAADVRAIEERKFATGGPVPVPAIIGKEGPELFAPGVTTVTINMTVANPSQVRAAVAASMRRSGRPTEFTQVSVDSAPTPADRQGFEPFSYTERS